MPQFAKEAKERQRASGKAVHRGKPKASVKNDGSFSSDGEARTQAAKALGVSAGTVQTVAAIAKDDPELFNDIKSGAVTLQEAKRRNSRKKIQSKVAARSLPPPRSCFTIILRDSEST
jgi:hypothetical protein